MIFFVALIGGMIYLQRENLFCKKFEASCGRASSAGSLPNQVLHRLVARYAEFADALPDSRSAGMVLGTGLALDQAMTRVSERWFIYPTATEFFTGDG